MANFFTDNKDIVFQFERLPLEEISQILENDYKEAEEFDYAPQDYADSFDNYRRVLEITGDISANVIAPNAAEVDEEGAHFENGKVTYAKGTQTAIAQLGEAELMGFTLPRKFGGLNMPITIYTMAIEIVAHADASLMNIFGLQDIAETIHRFGSEEQKAEFLPQFSSGEASGAMSLTEPDAGSDLQAVKMHAYQDDKGQWRLRGVKRFITNGNADIHLVLARSEAGTKDGRGLSMFVCYGKDGIIVRRIENKLGIHGSPTCELQFNDVPAQLVGKRKFGLIKYVMDLMNGARLGVSAQALGISQAAYDEAVSYARAREQFGKSICNIPAVANMLIDIRVRLEANRSLLYSAAISVDKRERLTEKIERLKEAGKDFSEESARYKEASKIAALLTPMTKYVLTEDANKITYDALQIHGGTGYMREFNVERLTRDARITNIYEGTSQLQVVAAIGGVVNDIFEKYFTEKENHEYKDALKGLAGKLKEIRKIFLEAKEIVSAKKDKNYQDVAAKELVELYSYQYVGYLLLDEAEVNADKVIIAHRYITGAMANARKNYETVQNGIFLETCEAGNILL